MIVNIPEQFHVFDQKDWPRKAHFEAFRHLDVPHFNLCTEVDITELRKVCKAKGYSLHIGLVYCLSRASNDVEALRMRIRGDDIVVHRYNHPSFTVLDEHNSFYYATFAWEAQFSLFHQAAEAAKAYAIQHQCLSNQPGHDHYMFMSSLPWLPISSMSHAMHYHPSDSVPRYSWGQFQRKGDKTLLNLSLQCHHALADGWHIGQFYQQLQHYCHQAQDFLI